MTNYPVIKQVNPEAFGVGRRPTRARLNKETFPWARLEVGDGFFVPDMDKLNPSTLSVYAFEKGLELNRKFSMRKAFGGRLVVRTA